MKVCFLSWHFNTPQIFLDYLRHQTPNKSGVWKDMVAVTNPNEADFIIIFDGYNGPFPKERALYFGQHPKVTGYSDNLSPSFRTFEGYPGKAHFPLDRSFNLGEWWIDYSYDELTRLEAPNKKKQLACIMTHQTHNAMYNQRLVFMRNLITHWGNLAYENILDMYGRPEEKFRQEALFNNYYKGSLGFNSPDGYMGNHKTGKNLLIDYRYSLEFDVGPTKNYVSERFYDSLLLWCMPIYFGSTNVHEYFPKDSFVNINLFEDGDIYRVINTVGSNHREVNLNAIAEARDLLLNKYQTWPAVYNILKGL